MIVRRCMSGTKSSTAPDMATGTGAARACGGVRGQEGVSIQYFVRSRVSHADAAGAGRGKPGTPAVARTEASSVRLTRPCGQLQLCGRRRAGANPCCPLCTAKLTPPSPFLGCLWCCCCCHPPSLAQADCGRGASGGWKRRRMMRTCTAGRLATRGAARNALALLKVARIVRSFSILVESQRFRARGAVQTQFPEPDF